MKIERRMSDVIGDQVNFWLAVGVIVAVVLGVLR